MKNLEEILRMQASTKFSARIINIIYIFFVGFSKLKTKIFFVIALYTHSSTHHNLVFLAAKINNIIILLKKTKKTFKHKNFNLFFFSVFRKFGEING